MIKKKNKEKEFLEKSSKVIKFLCLLIGIILTIVLKKYAITGALAGLTLIVMFVYLSRRNKQKKRSFG